MDTNKPTENTVKNEKKNKPWLFQPGVSGNPAGKPKGTKHFNTIFNELLKEQIVLKDGTKVSIGKAIARAMMHKAMKGDVHAFDSIADRIDGKATQSVEVEVTELPTPIYGGNSISTNNKRANR